MADWSKWNPLKIPDAWRGSTSATDDSEDPLNSWDASDWDEPDSDGGFISRITPNHAGQWLLLGAGLTVVIGFVLWLGQFFPLTSGNPWVLVATLWPASLAVVYARGRERGFMRIRDLDWSFVITGRSVTVLPGQFVERFGEGDIKHVKFSLLKSRTWGAFKFNFLKLGDLEADREKLVSKASGSNRGPDSRAHLLLPGALTGENSDTVLGRVFGVHGSKLSYYDNGQETDMRVKKPNTLDDDIAADVLSQLELFDMRVIPELKSEIETLVTQKERYKARAEAERDPELDRLLSSVDVISSIIRGDGQRGDSEGESAAADVDESVREQLEEMRSS